MRHCAVPAPTTRQRHPSTHLVQIRPPDLDASGRAEDIGRYSTRSLNGEIDNAGRGMDRSQRHANSAPSDGLNCLVNGAAALTG